MRSQHLPATLSILALAMILATTASAADPAPGKADGVGGLAGLAQDDIDALREVRDMLKQAAFDAREHPDDQRRALAGLARIHEALNDWGMDGQSDLYLKAILDGSKHASDLARLAETSAKGGAYHLAGVREFWTKLEAQLGDLTGELRRRRAEFDRLTRDLAKRAPRMADMLRPMKLQPKPVDPNTLRPWKLTPRTIDMKSMLTPYKA